MKRSLLPNPHRVHPHKSVVEVGEIEQNGHVLDVTLDQPFNNTR